MEAAFKSDIGQVRAHNEDNGGVIHNKEGLLLAIVADGMGGHQAGDIASKMTIEILAEKWREIEGITTPSSIEAWLNEAITDVNAQIFNHSLNHPQCQGMGTTLVAVVCTSRFVTYAHIGDSRAYVMDGATLLQKTEDHSLVNELVRSGQITALEAENHPRKNVLLRALGTERTLKIDIKTIEWEANSYILLCSDGLSNKVNSEEMFQVLKKEETIENKVTELIYIANERGGEDNITVALVYNSCKENNCGDDNDR